MVATPVLGAILHDRFNGPTMMAAPLWRGFVLSVTPGSSSGIAKSGQWEQAEHKYTGLLREDDSYFADPTTY